MDTALDLFYDAVNNVSIMTASKKKNRTVNMTAAAAATAVHEPSMDTQNGPFSPDPEAENLTLSSFTKTIAKVLDRVGQCDISHLVMGVGEADTAITDADIPAEAALKSSLSRKLVEDAAKMKAYDLTRHVPMESLKNLLVSLLPTILRGYIVASDRLAFMQVWIMDWHVVHFHCRRRLRWEFSCNEKV